MSSSIPAYRLGALKTISKREMAKRFPAMFSFTVERNGWIGRYISDVPAFASAEAWVDRISKQDEPPQSWCVLEPHADNEIYMVAVYQQVVQKAVICSQATLLADVTLQRCEQVFVTDEVLIGHLTDDRTYQVVRALSTAELAPFALKKHVSILPWIIAGVTTITVATGIGFWQTPEPLPAPEPEMEVVVDPYLVYRTSLSQSADAGKVLNQAVGLGAYGALLPDQWPLQSIEFVSGQLRLSATRQPLGQHSVMQTWLNGHSVLETAGCHSVLDVPSFTLLCPTPITLARWQGSIASTSAITLPLRDALIGLEWMIDTSDNSYPQPYVTPLSFSKANASLSELKYVSQLLAETPVGIHTFTMKPTAHGHYTIRLVLNVFGQQ
ncbi:hypothetical protein [Shewanella baltica]|uniref:hypothetical protein n=1 Tax=Shewanella baltica TaxID=62322 RepID=UPI0002112FFF|nr:hypothetical protein [Shewanella baltica]AEH16350.1 hypothetical protein Sbal117_4716 [Shewanella baltica OS117]